MFGLRFVKLGNFAVNKSRFPMLLKALSTHALSTYAV